MQKTIFIAIISLFFQACDSQETKLRPIEFSKKLNEFSTKNLVDVRTKAEFDEGHIDFAENIDWNGEDFEDFISRYNRNAPLFLYCLSGGRSSNAAKKARSLGFKKVYELDGGMMAWRSANLPEISPKGSLQNQMTKKEFEALFMGKKKQVLIDFYADWCAPCKKMKPYLDTLAKNMSDKLEIVRINADKHPQLCKELGVEGLPYLLMYSEDKLLWKRMGYVNEQELRTIVTK